MRLFLHVFLLQNDNFALGLEIFEKLTLPLIASTVDEVEGKVWICVSCGKRSKNR